MITPITYYGTINIDCAVVLKNTNPEYGIVNTAFYCIK